jgi:hypothetical protein
LEQPDLLSPGSTTTGTTRIGNRARSAQWSVDHLVQVGKSMLVNGLDDVVRLTPAGEEWAVR